MIALTLSGGSAWGIAHIGVLEVFEKNDIKVDLITGTSAGAVVGSFWAAGVSTIEMKRLLGNVNWTTFGSLVVPKIGLLDSGNIGDFIEKNIGENIEFKDLKIPLEVVTADLVTGEMVVLNKGRLSIAIRASASIPLLFTPVEFENRLLVDGGLLNNLPVDIAIARGADSVVAVDFTYGKMAIKELNSHWEIGLRSLAMLQEEKVGKMREMASVLIEPHIEDISPTDLKKADLLIKRGREATLKVLPEIKKLL